MLFSKVVLVFGLPGSKVRISGIVSQSGFCFVCLNVVDAFAMLSSMCADLNPLSKKYPFISWSRVSLSSGLLQILHSLTAWLYGSDLLICGGWHDSYCMYACTSIGFVYRSVLSPPWPFLDTCTSKKCIVSSDVSYVNFIVSCMLFRCIMNRASASCPFSNWAYTSSMYLCHRVGLSFC